MLKVDERLIRKCIKGENQAIEELYHLASAGLFGICLRYANNREDAQDLLHDGFLKIMDNLKRFRWEGSFEGWLRRIIVNEAINYYRRGNFIHFKEYESVDFKIEGFELSGLERMTQQELLGLLEKLPAGYRIVFNLFAIEEFSHPEISKMLNISESTSKSQYRKARLKLQELVIKMNKVTIKETIKSGK
ncbi:MAG: sigma-70 family RNA polymerase sigma factor [Bacteroidales bacterium]|nr:sigma-70 family RNA polymerase sigma factor [Bacteroidales bacterium]